MFALQLAIPSVTVTVPVASIAPPDPLRVKLSWRELFVTVTVPAEMAPPSLGQELSEKVRLEIGVSDHFVEPTVQAIMRGARTGDVGDGKIFVVPVEKVFRIRTGEEDQAAVTPVTVGTSG